MAGTVYLLHFDRPFSHARRYMGWTGGRLQDRLDRHRSGDGANLLGHVTDAGIGWTLSRSSTGDRHRERQVTRRGGHSRKCHIRKTGTPTTPAVEVAATAAGASGGRP